jgi:exosortase
VDTYWTFAVVGTLLVGVWFALGFQWLKALFLPISYLVFAMPFAGSIIDTYTNPLQIISTKAAFFLLKLYGFTAYKETPTIVHLDHFTLDVAVPCSGLKLLVAVAAFTVFFVLVARLRWWANVILFAMVLPLSVFINGLRISLIGVVGEMWGRDMGYKFHDYSGYIVLIVCFFILFKVARLLGWRD